jgi:type II secretory pathway component PulM
MIMRNQPPNFRWWVGGFALLAGLAFGWRFLSSGDRPALVFAVISLALAGYWLIFDREPEPPDRQSS